MTGHMKGGFGRGPGNPDVVNQIYHILQDRNFANRGITTKMREDGFTRRPQTELDVITDVSFLLSQSTFLLLIHILVSAPSGARQ